MLGSMPKRWFLGQITPSSNTVLEPVCARMLADLPHVTPHFARFQVTRIALSGDALKQFDPAPMVGAACQLAEARVNSICWNGTAAGWMGFDQDVRLCEAIKDATGIPACTSVLAFNEVLEKTSVKKFGLVAPYTADVQAAIIRNYAENGWECVSEEHFNDKGNFSFSEYSEERICDAIRHVAAERPEAILIYCTNVRGAFVVERMERELNIPIYDSVSVAVWKSMLTAGLDPRLIRGWGRLFQEVR